MKNNDSNDPMTKWRWKMPPIDRNVESTNIKKSCFRLIGILLIGCVCLFVFINVIHSKITKENLDSVSWLPPEAKNISWHGGYSFHIYECDMEEEIALAFAKESGWDFQPIEESKPFEILCYPFSTMSDWQKEISDAYYSKSNSNNMYYRYHLSEGYAYDGSSHRGGVTTAYDSKHKRLFVFISRR